jgi:hypothetical protein
MVSKDSEGQPIAAIDRRLGERREGVAIASARPDHEVDLHRWPSVVRPIWSPR